MDPNAPGRYWVLHNEPYPNGTVLVDVEDHADSYEEAIEAVMRRRNDLMGGELWIFPASCVRKARLPDRTQNAAQ